MYNLWKKQFEIKNPAPSPHRCQDFDLATPLAIYLKEITGQLDKGGGIKLLNQSVLYNVKQWKQPKYPVIGG